MFDHLLIAFGCWTISATIPSLPNTYSATLTIIGFIAFFLFLKDLNLKLKQQFLAKTKEAEHNTKRNLSSFSGKFVTMRNEHSPFSTEFSYLIFDNGEIHVPLFCRNAAVIRKAVESDNHLLIIYYQDYLLIDVELLEKDEVMDHS
ncbi:hypothetical protein ACQYAD_12970 [Neobacillus sp. SM06]|uniref:hypothetical protein n=1 Tax=Neobacillus sp. SM06 TaxID=3422492 RepID=UPI003D27C176